MIYPRAKRAMAWSGVLQGVAQGDHEGRHRSTTKGGAQGDYEGQRKLTICTRDVKILNLWNRTYDKGQLRSSEFMGDKIYWPGSLNLKIRHCVFNNVFKIKDKFSIKGPNNVFLDLIWVCNLLYHPILNASE